MDKIAEMYHCNIIDTVCPYDYSCNVCRLHNDYEAALEKAVKLEEEIEQGG